MHPMFESHPLFKGLSKAHLTLLEDLSAQEIVPKGTVLLQEGEISSQFYLILTGEVEIVKRSEEGNELRIRTLKAGDLIGN
jgi:CRP-like cAMP-binding protein